MTVSEMVTFIQYRLDDPNGDRYTSTICLAALNAQQEEISGLADAGLLIDLQTSQSFKAISGGNALNADYFRYISSRQTARANRGWITKVDMENLGELQDNQYTKGTDNNPLCYIWNGKYYLLIDTYGGDNDDVTLYYLKSPTDMVVGGTCQLHITLHNALCDLAESYLRATYKHGTLEEAIVIRKTALEKINQVNAMYKRGLIV
jgi:hypothetical protein